MRLISIDSFETLELAFNIYQSNEIYFSKLMGSSPTKDDVLEDRLTLPIDAKFTQKKYALIEYNDQIIGVIDIIYDYPNTTTNYINLLMLDKKYQHQEYGSHVLIQLLQQFKQDGSKKVKVPVPILNKEALNFWKKHSFVIPENQAKDFLILEKDIT